jgi:hypothetical protein
VAGALVGVSTPRLALVLSQPRVGSRPPQAEVEADAGAVAAALRAAGFVVMLREDVGLAEQEAALREFERRLTPQTIAVVYAGAPAAVVEGRGWLLVRDTPWPLAGSALAGRALSLDRLAQALAPAGLPQGARLLLVHAAPPPAPWAPAGVAGSNAADGIEALSPHRTWPSDSRPFVASAGTLVLLAAQPSPSVSGTAQSSMPLPGAASRALEAAPGATEIGADRPHPRELAATPLARAMVDALLVRGATAPEVVGLMQRALQRDGLPAAWVAGDTAEQEELAELTVLDLLPRTPEEAAREAASQGFRMATRAADATATAGAPGSPVAVASESGTVADVGAVEQPAGPESRSPAAPQRGEAARGGPSLPGVGIAVGAAATLATVGAVAGAAGATEAVAALPAAIGVATLAADTVRGVVQAVVPGGSGSAAAGAGPAEDPPGPAVATPPPADGQRAAAEAARRAASAAAAAALPLALRPRLGEAQDITAPGAVQGAPSPPEATLAPRRNPLGFAEGDRFVWQQHDLWGGRQWTLEQPIDNVAPDGSLLGAGDTWRLDPEGRPHRRLSPDGTVSLFEPALPLWWAQPRRGERRQVRFRESYVRPDGSAGHADYAGRGTVGRVRTVETAAGRFQAIPIYFSGVVVDRPTRGPGFEGSWRATVWYVQALAQPVLIETIEHGTDGHTRRRERLELTAMQRAATAAR